MKDVSSSKFPVSGPAENPAECEYNAAEPAIIAAVIGIAISAGSFRELLWIFATVYDSALA